MSGRDAQLHQVKQLIRQLGEKTVIVVASSVKAMIENNMEAASLARGCAKEAADLARAADKMCVNYIADHDAAADNARFLAATLKITSELERVADYGDNIARLAQDTFPYLEVSSFAVLFGEFEEMALESVSMLKSSLKSYEEHDENLARTVLKSDKTVNSLHRKLFKEILAAVTVRPWTQEIALYLNIVARYLERSADRSVNIAQWVFYINSGSHYTE